MRRGAAFVGFTGRLSASPAARASQRRATGQTRQRGARGVQTRAPSSISAWFRSPGDGPLASRAASPQSRLATAGILRAHL